MRFLSWLVVLVMMAFATGHPAPKSKTFTAIEFVHNDRTPSYFPSQPSNRTIPKIQIIQPDRPQRYRYNGPANNIFSDSPFFSTMMAIGPGPAFQAPNDARKWTTRHLEAVSINRLNQTVTIPLAGGWEAYETGEADQYTRSVWSETWADYYSKSRAWDDEMSAWSEQQYTAPYAEVTATADYYRSAAPSEEYGYYSEYQMSQTRPPAGAVYRSAMPTATVETDDSRYYPRAPSLLAPATGEGEATESFEGAFQQAFATATGPIPYRDTLPASRVGRRRE